MAFSVRFPAVPCYSYVYGGTAASANFDSVSKGHFNVFVSRYLQLQAGHGETVQGCSALLRAGKARSAYAALYLLATAEAETDESKQRSLMLNSDGLFHLLDPARMPKDPPQLSALSTQLRDVFEVQARQRLQPFLLAKKFDHSLTLTWPEEQRSDLLRFARAVLKGEPVPVAAKTTDATEIKSNEQ